MHEIGELTGGSAIRPARWSSRHRAVNIAASIVLSAGAVVFSGYAALLTVFLAMATGTCGPGECNVDVVNWTILIGLAGVVLILLAMLTLVVRSLMRRRCALWWPLIAVMLIAALWFLCAVIVSAAVGN